MLDLQDIRLYLPKYLSAESEKELLENLEKYPDNDPSKFFSIVYSSKKEILQGDAYDKLLIVNLPDTTVVERKGIILSNSCDVDLTNPRRYQSTVCYAPLINYQKFVEGLKAKYPSENQQIDSLSQSIRRQEVTSILYLPPSPGFPIESIVFLDKISSCINSQEFQDKFTDHKLFSLSNFGFYIFLFKLSLHFSRIKEKVDRDIPT